MCDWNKDDFKRKSTASGHNEIKKGGECILRNFEVSLPELCPKLSEQGHCTQERKLKMGESMFRDTFIKLALLANSWIK